MRRTGYYSMGERKFPEVIVEGGGLYVFTDTLIKLLRFYWHSLYGRPSGGVVFLFHVFTSRSTLLATSGGSIFRCTAKDRGERRAKGIAIPLNPLG